MVRLLPLLSRYFLRPGNRICSTPRFNCRPMHVQARGPHHNLVGQASRLQEWSRCVSVKGRAVSLRPPSLQHCFRRARRARPTKCQFVAQSRWLTLRLLKLLGKKAADPENRVHTMCCASRRESRLRDAFCPQSRAVCSLNENQTPGIAKKQAIPATHEFVGAKHSEAGGQFVSDL